MFELVSKKFSVEISHDSNLDDMLPLQHLKTIHDMFDAVVTRGQRPEVRAGPGPHGCPRILARIMQQCWADDPTKRPSMESIRNSLNSDACRQEWRAFELGQISGAGRLSTKRDMRMHARGHERSANPMKQGGGGEGGFAR